MTNGGLSALNFLAHTQPGYTRKRKSFSLLEPWVHSPGNSANCTPSRLQVNGITTRSTQGALREITQVSALIAPDCCWATIFFSEGWFFPSNWGCMFLIHSSTTMRSTIGGV